MQTAHVSAVLIWTISLAGILCMLLRPMRIGQAYWACGAGILLVLTRLLPLPQAAHAVYEGWNVYLFLTGMMILAELAREEKVFEWVADLAARHAGNSPGRLFFHFFFVCYFFSPFPSKYRSGIISPARRSRRGPPS